MKVKFFILILVLTLSGCDYSQASVKRTEFALGTYITVRIDGMSTRQAEYALKLAFNRLYEIEALASAKNPNSALAVVNENAFETYVHVSEELFFLLKTGLYYSELTDGAFDITLGTIVELWGINTENARVPTQEELAEALENSGFEHLVLNEDVNSVRFLKEGLKIDLGALAKGYAADEMKRVLVENGVENAVLDLGGDIITIGDKNGAGWLVGLEHPRNFGEICAKLRVSGLAIVTSGDYQRNFTHDGKLYHHIFDSRTGFPADSGIVSATVIAESAMIADALSTALFVTGEALPDIDFILIDSDMNFVYSENLNFELVN